MNFLTGLIFITLVSNIRTAENTIRLRWTDPMGRQPQTYREWLLSQSVLDRRTCVGSVVQTGTLNVIEVMVNAEIYQDLTAELDQYANDLIALGYSVRIDTMRSSSHQALRTFLQSQSELVGVLLVGELPVAWYEDDWGGTAPEEFPCDLYFADLNGTWVDNDGDGLYDDHTGNVAPEIWIGRLSAKPLTWDDETRLLKHYFYKNHLYRTGGLTLPDRGLCFNDDDWSGYGNCGLTAIYPSVTVIEQHNQTTAPIYRTQLLTGFEWIHVMSHSSPWGHTFDSDNGYTGTVFNCEVYALQPHANFYNLFACSGARFIEENYSAGWDIFNEDWGLLVVGSTKTGSMLNFEDFYTPIGADSCIGDAFKSWFIQNGEWSRDWFYGLVILGDPTLKPRHNLINHQRLTQNLLPVNAVSNPLTEIVGADPETDAEPVIAKAPDGKLWCVWVSGRSTTNGRFEIYSSYRTQSSGWSTPIVIGPDLYWDCDPAIGIDSLGRPVVVWANFENSYHYNLHYSYWNGSSWSPEQSFPDDPAGDMKPTLTRDSSGRLWCFWESRQDYYSDIWTSSWNGTNWSAPEQVTRDTSDEHFPAALIDHSGKLWVFYTRYHQGITEIWGSYWSGSNWVRSGPISANQHKVMRPGCSTGGEDGGIWVAWQSFDDNNGEIYVSHYNDTIWSAPVSLSQSPMTLDVHPVMTSDILNRPWVVWQSKNNGNWTIETVYYMDGEWRHEDIGATGQFNINPSLGFVPPEAMWFVWQNYEPGGNWEINAASINLVEISEQTPRPATSAPTVSCSPNPTRSAVFVFTRFSEPYILTIADCTGRIVRNLGWFTPGERTIAWDSRDGISRTVASGIYFVLLNSKTVSSKTKLILVR
ncbi:MAG: hypothetical protein OEZ20_06980 [candidate division WOR-3 bacterium]|nr:hypothetical protein [candidate division WOR-3 bacterium]